ncbi:type I polyketide synthase [Bacillus paralicheniformis]|uniref:type I polyketide synthase n=1 Tax=Bacillus paralicheniformis TaxID=1648923 RepID=UPI000D025942|nr:type I polyketide synthase [Bacillus paralicheniformis]
MSNTSLDIAIVGMSCLFPEASSPEQFWCNLRDGMETIKFYTDEQLMEQGVPKELLQNTNYVKAASVLESREMFDADFFGINPNEARAMDPQHRVFLECCWEALEDAGYDPSVFDGDIGVYAGLGMNSYIYDVLGKNPAFLNSISQEQMNIGNDKDFLPTRVSYKLNLTGPSINVNTACSTSLVAIHLARQSLLLGESDMVLAGGVSVFLPSSKGYMYVQDSIQSPDGHCRAFDEKAQGTIWGDGCGVVLLKRLDDAIQAGDNIYAVIKGSAVNNDGMLKMGYTAPSIEAQSRVIVEALSAAGLSAEQIGYIEAHGTGTQLGDPVEIAALTEAFYSETDKRGYCPIGSVKTNIGHTNAAAGIAGLLKAVLAIKHKQLPPNLHFEKPNSNIDFNNSPFYVNNKLADWENGGEPLRAGVNSMGIGGTNCHVIVEEAPVIHHSATDEAESTEFLLVLSARSAQALEQTTANLAQYLNEHRNLSLEDVAFTLQCGRRSFYYRKAVVCRSIDEAVHLLQNGDPNDMMNRHSMENTELATGHWQAELLHSWLNGEEVNWQQSWSGRTPRRVPLPTYPFERKRYWVDPEPLGEPIDKNDDESYFKKIEDMADWFYAPSWKQESLPYKAPKTTSKTRLVFVPDLKFGEEIAKCLSESGDTVIRVVKGKEFKRIENLSFSLHPQELDGYVELIKELRESGHIPDSILFLWSLETIVNSEIQLDLETLISGQEHGFFSILQFMKALDQVAWKDPIEFIAVTNNTFDVLGSEELNLNASTIYGMSLVIQQAFDYLTSRVVDVVIPKSGSAQRRKLIKALHNEIMQQPSELLSVYRHGDKRFVRRYEPVRVEEDAPREHGIKQGGTYVMYAGLEGIGSLVSEHVLRQGGKLILLEEEGFPKIEDWETWIEEHDEEDFWRERIKTAKQLIDIGAQYAGSLSSDMVNNQRLLESIEQRFGKVSGIIHAPASSNAKRTQAIKHATIETWMSHFKDVSYSMIMFDQMFSGKDLDFRIMLNSLGSVLGGDGFINIATTSNHVKAYLNAKYRNSEHGWLIQCWDSWTIEWTIVGKYLPSAVYERVAPSVIMHDEGLMCFDRLFAIDNLSEVDISCTDLHKRYKKWITSIYLKDTDDHVEKDINERFILDDRPELGVKYIPPQGQTEQWLAGIFSELLGIAEVGRNDNFFDFGGHSLLGIQLASKIRKRFAVDLDLYYIYNFPTVSSLAGYLESDDPSKLARELVSSRWTRQL